ncbi:MAG: GH3 auxin-responsive promoter family protein [Kineosporiaceae bacterium]
MDEAVFRAEVARARESLRAELGDVHAAQHAVLTRVLAANADARFGREHGFARLRDLAAYRRAVPIRDDVSMRRWTEAAARGERSVLTSQEPTLFFRGREAGCARVVPVTPRYVHEVVLPLAYAAAAPFLQVPDALARRDAVFTLNWDPSAPSGRTPAGRPVVGPAELDAVRAFDAPAPLEPGRDAPWMQLPVRVAADDWLERLYLRLRVAAASDVQVIAAADAAQLAGLADLLDVVAERLVRDLHDGTLSGVDLGDPRPDLAAALQRQADAAGRLLPAHVWPRLRLLHCSPVGLAAVFLPRLREQFGVGVAAGYAPVGSADAMLGAPLDRHARAVTAAVGRVLFEFVGVDDEITPDTDTLAAWEVQAGKEYQVVITHVGGAYRYRLDDVVRVVDVVRGVPRLEPVGSAVPHVVAGVPLRESHVVRAAVMAGERTGIELRNLRCRDAEGEPRYELLVEGWQPLDAEDRELLAAAFDSELARASSEYAEARDEARLRPVRLVEAPTGTFAAHWRRRVERGTPPPQATDRVFERAPALWAAAAAGSTGGDVVDVRQRSRVR